MKLIDQSWEWVIKPINPLETLERIGRVCYKSEDKITPESAPRFVKMLIDNKHESVLEHITASVRFITMRSVTHELVRHRHCAFSQESTRYISYKGKDIEFINPIGAPKDYIPLDYETTLCKLEEVYNSLLAKGWKPQGAREILPNALKTEIVVTTNLREWRHIFKMRISKEAHPQIRALMTSCLEGFKREIPVIFDDIGGLDGKGTKYRE